MTAGDDVDLEQLLTSGVRLSRLTVLDVVCRHQKRLVRVLKIGDEVRMLYADVAHGALEDTGRPGIVHQHDWVLGYLHGNDPDAYFYPSSACCAPRVDVAWVERQVAAGTRRAVAPAEA
ncbi:MAG: hypothetical protein U0R76_18310 [Candidatus Nanopelagicales bacterium]